jgi:hypothetical protein
VLAAPRIPLDNSVPSPGWIGDENDTEVRTAQAGGPNGESFGESFLLSFTLVMSRQGDEPRLAARLSSEHDQTKGQQHPCAGHASGRTERWVEISLGLRRQ